MRHLILFDVKPHQNGLGIKHIMAFLPIAPNGGDNLKYIFQNSTLTALWLDHVCM